MNGLSGIEWAVSPFQGWDVGGRHVPRALPWAELLRPLRGVTSSSLGVAPIGVCRRGSVRRFFTFQLAWCYLDTTTRHRARSTASTGRIGHGSATHQTASLWGKLNRASLPRPQVRAGALNLGDDLGRYEDLITTERPFGCPEITERRIRRRKTRPRRMRSTSAS